MPPARACFPFMGRELGGSHFSARGLIRGLDRSRYRPVLVFQHSDGPVFDHFRGEDAEIAFSPEIPEFEPGQAFSTASLVRALSGAGALADFLRGLSIDIVHCNDGRTNAVWSAPAKLAGASLIWHNRGNPSAKGLRFAAPLIADRVISVSAFASPRPGVYSAANKNDVVYSPFDVTLDIDRAAARAALVAELGCAPETSFVGYFGLLIDRKRPLLFVETIAMMRKSASAMPVMGLFFGEAYAGLAGAALALANELGVADSIRMMGFRSPGPVWIAACDLLLATAVDEPFGRTLIEAMIVGTPVVATASGGNIEAIIDGQTGVLAPADNATALAAAAVRVLGDRALYARLAAAASADARNKFGEDRHVDAVMRIYDDTLAGRRRKAGAAGSKAKASTEGVA
ncbi:MAG: glycosyltransferase family 4 protein [Parvularculaceae bacterium]